MTRITSFISLFIILSCICPRPAFGQESEVRFALVIGNGNYSALGKLANPGQ